jgi:uncharacterized glyoxalase superfamily protein PhnB
MVQRLGTVRELVPLLFVQNIETSVAFYRDALGFEVAGTWQPDDKLAWCRLEREGCALMLQQATEEDGPPESRGHGIAFFFICDDAAKIHDELISRGMHLSPPKDAFYGMKQVYVKDPDGYELCFESPTEKA